jgi:Holliday junction resolvasome RuvABC endonuclease subunit
LAIDQAREGAWSIFDYDTKALMEFGCYSFQSDGYSYPQVLVAVCELTKNLVVQHGVSAIFIEDIQLRKNVDSFKKLAQLQGSLIALFEREEYLYDLVPPTKWQSFCGARGRTAKEVKGKVTALESDKKQSKVLSIQFVKHMFDIDTDNDNLSDAICMGYYVVQKIKLSEDEE